MTFAVVEGRASGATSTTDTTSHAITLPTGIVAGELLIVAFSVDANPTCSTSSDGWNFLGQTAASNDVTGAILWKIATGSDSLTVTTSTAQQSSHVSLRVSGHSGILTGTSAISIGSSNTNPPNHTGPAGTQDYLVIATRHGDSTVVATAAPSSYGNLQTQAAAGTGGASTNTAERSVAGSSEDPGAFTSASEQWVSWTLFVMPVGWPTVREVVADELLFDAGPDLTVTTSSGTATGDTLLAWHGATFGSSAEAGGPSPGTWALEAEADAGDDEVHLKLWSRAVSSGGAQTVTVTDGVGDSDLALTVVVLVGAVDVDAAASNTGTTSTSHVAPSISPSAAALLLCGWMTAGVNGEGNYTPPSPMWELAELDMDTYSTQAVALQGLTASGATGTRTASFARLTGTDAYGWGAISAALLSAAGTSAPAGHASGTGTAHTPTARVSAAAGHAAGTGTAQAPTARVSAAAGHAAGTGTAHTPTAAIAAAAGHAAGTGTAHAPTVDTAAGEVSAAAGHAAGTGTAHTATAGVSAAAGHAAGSGTAHSPAVAIAAAAGHAAGAGAAHGPTVRTDPNVPAGHASGTGTAHTPTARVSAAAGHASGTGTAHTPTPSVRAAAGHASGTGAAHAATPNAGQIVVDVFPDAPREVSVELYLADGWRDITDHVYQRDPITISRGRANEAGGVDPATATMTLDNRTGAYSPRNPLGPWYGSIGRNTPIRIALNRARDSFSRIVAAGWGSADVGGAWAVTGLDYAVSSGAATIALTTAATTRTNYLPERTFRDVDVAVTVTVPDSDITGAPVLAGIDLRRNAAQSTGYLCYISISTAEAVQVAIYDWASAAFVVGLTTVPGLTHSAGQELRIRAQADGQTLRCKVWPADDPEPFDWHAAGHDDSTPAGHVGLYASAPSGQTDVPITLSYADLQVGSVRFHGEVSSWPTRTDLSGRDAWVQIEAGGLRRRLAQGASTIQSSFRRSTPFLPDLLEYWPMEDAAGATELASALPDGPPMYRNGPVKFGANTDFVASDALPTLDGGILFARPREYTPTGQTQVRFLCSVPSSGGTDQTALLWLLCSGTAPQWRLNYHTGGALSLAAYDTAGTTELFTTGPIGFAIDGRPCRLGVELVQDGADVDYRITELEEDSAAAGFAFQWDGTLSGRTVGRVLTIQLNMDGGNAGVGVGHVTLEDATTNQFDQAEELMAYASGDEQAGERIQRLCSENGLPFAWIGSLTETDMGPQPLAPLLDALDDAADADGGTLVESRSAHALVFRARSTLYNADPVAALSYDDHEIAAPFEPLDDDAFTRNDVTFSRAYGSNARAVREDGPLAVSDPSAGGVGRYQVTIAGNTFSDVDNEHHAGWWLHLGTVDEPRLPRITVDLAAPAVAAHDTLPADLLDVDVDDRISIDGATSIGFYTTTEQRVLGYSEWFQAYRHKITLHCAPASPYDVIVLDDDAWRLDSATSSLTSDITSSATSISVTTSDPADLWTTDAAEAPFDIQIGGEVLTVTAVSGTSSPQTFTVTRAVNAVTKTHAAGAQVRLARAPVVAL